MVNHLRLHTGARDGAPPSEDGGGAPGSTTPLPEEAFWVASQYQGRSCWCPTPEAHSHRRSGEKLCQMLAASALAHSGEHLSGEEFPPVPAVTHSHPTAARHPSGRQRRSTQLGGGCMGQTPSPGPACPCKDERNSPILLPSHPSRPLTWSPPNCLITSLLTKPSMSTTEGRCDSCS